MSSLSTVDETSTVNSERESTLISKDKIQQLCEETKLLKKMMKWQEKLNTLQNTQKHSQSESLDIAIFNLIPTKHLSILRPPQHIKHYQTGTYTQYCQFISDIESIHNTSKLNNEDTLTYALTELELITEIGEEFEDSTKIKKNLFIWSLNKLMQTKLNEQLEIPDDIDDIVALAI
ncbi:conserved hypothetical protein [Coccidioides posadasii str. Silveira]|uniref:Uncharacterized protein n=1 Tax=Coccidioides posadasii (strain RMSCC 757 / Silveira) TaxID=443226 RepID=E9DFN2_COCPS|nr:conserved hypothetical protein [Coccidioides posadasii str. Silveira]